MAVNAVGKRPSFGPLLIAVNYYRKLCITWTPGVNFTNMLEQLLRQNPFAKKLQTQIVST
jgi:hypothetical protein